LSSREGTERNRLNSISETKQTHGITKDSVVVNDLDPKKWREYEKEGLQFFSVWDTPERDPLGWTLESIHGNCPVEIPRQCIWRFSKEGEKILDPFVGSGTTLAACARLKRIGVGVEVNPNIATIAKRNLSMQTMDAKTNRWIGKQKIIIGDSTDLKSLGIEDESIDMCFSHPPYWNLVNYGEEHGKVSGDLSDSSTLERFLIGIEKSFCEVLRVLKPKRHFCVLIGEAFLSGGKVIPLEYYLTGLALKTGFEFYSAAIKYTRLATSRMNSMNIMKYRSLRSNFLICIHDYILIFRKP
jgi:DNA modification methylase